MEAVCNESQYANANQRLTDKMRINPKSKTIHYQEKKYWCWAAATSHVVDCYTKYVHQDHVASMTLDFCTGDCVNTPCNIPYYIDRALSKVQHCGRWHPGHITPSVVEYEISKGRPVAVRINWGNSRDGHFVVIVGYNERKSGAILYTVFDPAKSVGLHVMGSDTFKNRYQIAGYWSESIFTK